MSGIKQNNFSTDTDSPHSPKYILFGGFYQFEKQRYLIFIICTVHRSSWKSAMFGTDLLFCRFWCTHMQNEGIVIKLEA